MIQSIPNDLKKQQRRAEYVARINRVMDHIEANITGDLSLQTLAKVAHFSRYHFHRVFGAMVGETLSQYIQRVRAERAARQLVFNPTTSVTEVAFDCGYSSSATFARAFREAFDMSPTQWRAHHVEGSKICKAKRKDSQAIRKQGNDFRVLSIHIDEETNRPVWRFEMNELKDVKVDIQEMPELCVAYVRHLGPYAGQSDVFEKMFMTLMAWAGPRGLLRFPETKMLSVYHDDPNVTDESKLRTSGCISVPPDTEVGGEIGKMTVAGGTFAMARFELTAEQYADAWDAVMGGWMPESGYQPDDRLSYELYHNNPKEHPEHKQIVDICVPVKPL